jgi:hypothetical protein
MPRGQSTHRPARQLAGAVPQWQLQAATAAGRVRSICARGQEAASPGVQRGHACIYGDPRHVGSCQMAHDPTWNDRSAAAAGRLVVMEIDN